jgi:hypothetical protein
MILVIKFLPCSEFFISINDGIIGFCITVQSATNEYQHHNNHKKLSWNYHSPEKNDVSFLIGNFGGEISFAVK